VRLFLPFSLFPVYEGIIMNSAESEEVGKYQIKDIIKELREEAKKDKFVHDWYMFLILGLRYKFLKGEDTLEHAVEISKAFTESFEEKLPYVV
jgi:hypothetical protein